MEKDLSELVHKLKTAVGRNLRSLVLYGSAASGEFHPQYSDLNVICILDRLDALELEKLNPAGVWWERKGHPAPVVFTLDNLRRLADVFAMELSDIKSSHRVLFGDDVFAALEVPMRDHRVQLEHELGTNLIRLRQSFLAAPPKPGRLLKLMTESISTFTALFRHALIALGEKPQFAKRAVVDHLAALLGFDPLPFHAVLDVREGKQRAKQLDAARTFRAYLEAVTRAVEEMDLRLKRAAHNE